MKKIFLLFLSFFFVAEAIAHSTKNINLDMNGQCRKKSSVLNWISKSKYQKGGEIIKCIQKVDQQWVYQVQGHKKVKKNGSK